jgi:4a-hydroxytetrahydrobiopterin dehydratase
MPKALEPAESFTLCRGPYDGHRMARLDDAAIDAALVDLPGWTRDGDAIVRTLRRAGWTSAIALVNAVAAEADRRDHHPDIAVSGYRNVTFRLTSHDAQGVTSRDLRLAAAIDRLAGDG